MSDNTSDNKDAIVKWLRTLADKIESEEVQSLSFGSLNDIIEDTPITAQMKQYRHTGVRGLILVYGDTENQQPVVQAMIDPIIETARMVFHH